MINTDAVSEIYAYSLKVEEYGKLAGFLGRLILVNSQKKNPSEKTHKRLVNAFARHVEDRPKPDFEWV